MSYDEQSDLILGILLDFLADDNCRNLGAYLAHVGFDICAITSPSDLIPAWLGHYRLRPGCYDVDRACADLATWPPVAARIVELQVRGSGG